MRIELAQRTHLTQIPAIELAAASMFSELDLPQNVRYRVTDTETLRDAWDDSRIWVALNYADKAVGFAMADIVDGQAHLDEMNVLPDYGRRGIGTQLVQTVKESWKPPSAIVQPIVAEPICLAKRYRAIQPPMTAWIDACP